MNLLPILGNFLIFTGMFFILTSLVGLKRFKDNLSKLHAIGISDVLGYPLCYTGLILKDFSGANNLKYFLLIVIVFITSPLVTHNMAKVINENSDPKVGKNG